MRTRKTILTTTLTVLTVLAITTASASASITRELVSTIGGSFEGDTGLAIDLETGNVYVADENTNTVNIFGANGGPPTGGVPSQITGLNFWHREGNGKPIYNWDASDIAIDNSCYEHKPILTETTVPTCKEFDPSYGDMYVADNRNEDIQKYQLNGGKYELGGELSYPGHVGSDGIAIDSQGNVYAGRGTRVDESKIFPGASIIEFKRSGEVIEIPQSIVGGLSLYVDAVSTNHVYISSTIENGGKSSWGVGRLEIGAAGEVLSEDLFAPPFEGGSADVFRPVAVDDASGNVIVGDGARVAEYNETGGEPLLEFGSSETVGGAFIGTSPIKSVAVNSNTGQVYATNESKGDVDVFGPVVEPPGIPQEQPGASDVTRTGALLSGIANPEGGSGTYWYEYASVSEYEPTANDPYKNGGRTASTVLPSAHADENIERVLLSGLLPGTTYHYRLIVHNVNTTTYGPDQTFTTVPPTPPIAVTGGAGEVGRTSATLTGSVDPNGLATSYVFEVGTSTNYGGARLFGNAGESTGEVPVSVSLAYLVPGTTYHYRLAATSFDGTTYGQDQTFTTPDIPSTVSQPVSIPLIATPQIQFPSITGAITEPTKITPKSTSNARKLKSALRACRRKPKKQQRAACEKRSRQQYKKTA